MADSNVDDLRVWDGTAWWSLSGADGKSFGLVDPQDATTVEPVDATTLGEATVKLTLDQVATDAAELLPDTDPNYMAKMYKLELGVPGGLKGQDSTVPGPPGPPGQSLELKGSVDYETPQTLDGTSNGATVLQEPASYMGTAGNNLGDLWIVRYQGDASAGGKVPDGNGFVMSEAADSTPEVPTYEWNEIGAIQGPKGDGWKSEGTGYDDSNGTVTFASDDGLEFTTGDLRGSNGANATISIDSTVLTSKLCATDDGTASMAKTEGEDSNPTYQLTRGIPQVTVTKATEDSGGPTEKCTGDFWIVTGS